jgi:putative redox protein
VGAEHAGVVATGAGGRFRTDLAIDGHALRADEPASVGGDETGPTPYDLVSAGLAACTHMTMRMYAERKGWTVDATVEVHHGKVHQRDCEDCADAVPGKDGRIDRFERVVTFGPGTDPAHHERLLEIANRCPVHLTLERGAAVVTRQGGND